MTPNKWLKRTPPSVTPLAIESEGHMRVHSVEELQRMFEAMGLATPEQRRAFLSQTDGLVDEPAITAGFVHTQDSTAPLEEGSHAKLA